MKTTLALLLVPAGLLLGSGTVTWVSAGRFPPNCLKMPENRGMKNVSKKISTKIARQPSSSG